MTDTSATDLTAEQQWARNIAQEMTHPRWVICPRSQHPSFLIDSNEMVGCPWCNTTPREPTADDLRAKARDLYRRSDNIPLGSRASIERVGDLREEADRLMKLADEQEG